MVKIFNLAVPGYLERDVVDLGGVWRRVGAPANIAAGAARPATAAARGDSEPSAAAGLTAAHTRGVGSVTRVWHGATRPEDADRYLHFLQEKGVQDYLQTPGILEVQIGRRVEADKAHFWTVSVWKDLDSIRAFAGCPVDKARYYPEDDGFLLEKEPTVLHYETYRIMG
jgi:heme-degrading monooxygenase HmoA